MVDMKEKVSSLNPILRLINPIQFGNPLPFSLYSRHGFCSESEHEIFIPQQFILTFVIKFNISRCLNIP